MRNDALYRGGRKSDLHVSQRRPAQDENMRALAQQTLSKLERMTDSDYDGQKFQFTYENE